MPIKLVLAVFLLVQTGLALAAPKIQFWRMDNGVRVYFVENHDLPLLDISVDFSAGYSRDPADKAGRAALAHHMLARGAGGLNEEEISKRMADVGAQLSGGFDADRAGVGLRTLSSARERDQALDVMARIIQQPEFPESVIQREKARTIAGIKEAETQPDHIAAKTFMALLYGKHPYGLQSSGEVATVSALTRQDLQDFYRDHYRADNAQVAIMGDVTAEQARAIVTQLTAKLPRGNAAQPLPPVALKIKAETRRIAHPATQAHILMGIPGIKRDDPDYFALYVGNYVLGGGGFDSRLIDEVRQKRGLAYSAYSYFMPMKQEGPFQIGLQTKRDQADQALAVVRDTVRRYVAEGPSEAELKQAKNNIIGGFPLRIDSNRKILDYLVAIGFYGLPLSYLDDFSAKVEKVSVADIKAAFARRVDPDAMVTVLVAADGPAK
ncbi:MAG: insulinase family protein [Sulfuricella sp.]|nr:insulinase family protein [Sulfuricella sp.]